MKKNFSLILAIVLFFSCKKPSENGFTLNGQISNVPAGTKIYLDELSYASTKGIDTAVVAADGKFDMKATIEHQGLFQLRLGKNKAMFLVLDEKPSSVQVTLDTSDFDKFSYKLSGSPASEQIRQYILSTRKFGDDFSQAMSVYHQNVNDQTPDSIEKMYAAKVKSANDAFLGFDTTYVDTTANPVIAIFAAFNLNYNDNRSTFDRLEARLRKDYSSLPFTQMFLATIGNEKNAAQQQQYQPRYGVGSVAPDIQLQSPDGKILKLSSLHGQYVLLDFWASWCGPCRKENPNVVRAYQQYKNKGFTIFSVSLDSDKDSWKEAIKKDQLSWPNHVSDLQGWQSSVCEQYGIRAIPQNFLLDKDGKIIAESLRGDDLMNALQRLLP